MNHMAPMNYHQWTTHNQVYQEHTHRQTKDNYLLRNHLLCNNLLGMVSDYTGNNTIGLIDMSNKMYWKLSTTCIHVSHIWVFWQYSNFVSYINDLKKIGKDF